MQTETQTETTQQTRLFTVQCKCGTKATEQDTTKEGAVIKAIARCGFKKINASPSPHGLPLSSKTLYPGVWCRKCAKDPNRRAIYSNQPKLDKAAELGLLPEKKPNMEVDLRTNVL